MGLWLTLLVEALTHVCEPPEFSQKMRVQVWVGDHYEEQPRVGGTQKIDGFSRVSDALLEDAPSTL